MSKATGALSILRRLVIVIAIAIVFVFGLGTTVYLSLRSPEVKVPDVMAKDRAEAERVLGDAGLNFRVRATRPSSQVKPDTVLFQLPRAGDVVKAGQTVAMDISRPVKEGEASDVSVAPSPEEKPANTNGNENLAANENKPKHPRNTNKNANENGNTNANANRTNRNANANRLTTNRNSNNSNTNRASTNSNRPAINGNSNRAVNNNGNARPAIARPSPTVRPN